MPDGKVCAMCGRALTTRQVIYCSAKCREQAKRERMRDGYKPSGSPGLYRKMICPDCGAEFVGHIKSYRCKACQEDARRKTDREYQQRRRAGTMRPLGSEDLCARCGEKYIVQSGMQKYCPACAPDALREHHAKRMREIMEDEGKKAQRAERRNIGPATRVCAICGKRFTAGAFAMTCSEGCRRKYLAEYYADYDKNRRKKETEHKI